MVLLLPLEVPMFVILAALLYFAMRRGLFQLLQSAIDSISTGIPGLNFVARHVRSAFNYVLHYIEKEVADAALAVERPLVGFVLHLGHLIQYTAFTVYYIPLHVKAALRALRHVVIPALLRALAHGLHVAIARVVAVEHALARELHVGYHHLFHYARATAHAAATTVAVPVHALDRRVGRTRADIRRLWRRLSRLEKELSVAALTGVVLAVLARKRLGWLRCGNVNRVGRALCRFPVRALEELLAGLFEVLVVSDLCQLVRLASKEARLFEPILHGLVVAEGAALCGGRHRAAPALRVAGVPAPVPPAPISL